MSTFFGTGAMADTGKPVNGGMNFQKGVTEIATTAHWLDHMVTIIVAIIVLLVTGLLLAVAFKFNRRKHPTPATFTHNTPVEVLWTLGPILILIFIGAFSLPALFRQQEFPEPDVLIKATGNQWYWSYEYPTEGISFDAQMLGNAATVSAEDEAAGVKPLILNDAMRAKLVAAGYNRDEFLLATDEAVVVPVGKIIVMQVTGADVIHSWTVPAFGVKQDGVPGRIAQLWFQADEIGTYFGQCSELCGMFHAYMPITVKVVSEADYATWLATKKAG
ncbi:MAG: cytochrome c oxidase subunit II [Deltaproteobacteria bacterium]